MRGMLIVVLAVLVGCAAPISVEPGGYKSTYGAEGKLSADILAGRIVLPNKPSRELWLAAAQSWMTPAERERATHLFAQQDAAEPLSDTPTPRAVTSTVSVFDDKFRPVIEYSVELPEKTNQDQGTISASLGAARRRGGGELTFHSVILVQYQASSWALFTSARDEMARALKTTQVKRDVQCLSGGCTYFEIISVEIPRDAIQRSVAFKSSLEFKLFGIGRSFLISLPADQVSLVWEEVKKPPRKT